MAGELLSFSISGVYSLLILSLTFNFLLAMRIKQLQDRFTSYAESTSKKMNILRERLEILASEEGTTSTPSETE